MPFEVFDKRAATATKAPMATIQKRGMFSINRAAFHAMGEPESVELLYDPTEKLIGFRPVASTSPRGFPVRPQGNNDSTYMIAGRAFTQNYGLDTETARRYAVEVQDGILILDLKSDSTDATGPRTAAN